MADHVFLEPRESSASIQRLVFVTLMAFYDAPQNIVPIVSRRLLLFDVL